MQIENMVQLYKEKNAEFRGEIVLIGHGISSLVIFDILANQTDEQNAENVNSTSPQSLEPKSVSQTGAESGVSGGSGDTLNSLLEKLNIENIAPKLEAEEIDLASLLILEESDLKDLGLPMGPRKKLAKVVYPYKVVELQTFCLVYRRKESSI